MSRGLKIALSMVTFYLFVIGHFFLTEPAETWATTIELKLSQPFSPKYYQQTQLLEPWAKQLEEHTNGQVKVKFFPGGALGKAGQIYSMVENGIVDIGFDLHDYTPGRFPAISVFELPFMISSAELGSEAMWKAYEQFESVRKEYKGVKVLWLSCHAPGFFNTTQKPIKSLEDLKGLKIRTASSMVTETLQLFGSTPVTMPATEVYNALEKGVVDGTVLPYDGLKAFKLEDVVKYIARADFYTMTFFVVMNQKKFDSLPQKAKEFINGHMGAMMSKASGKIFDQESKIVRKKFLDLGVKEFEFNDAEMKKLKQVVEPIEDKWLKEAASKGIDGQKLLKAVTKYCASPLQSKN